MTYLICCLITLFACVLGTICGMGGGIIIKPALDATGVMSVASVTFLSGCTVIAMCCWNIGRSFLKKEHRVELRTTGILTLAAAIGGLLGKQLYAIAAGLFADPDTAGGLQAALLLCATGATLAYTVCKDSIPTRQISSPMVSFAAGLLLGMLGAFLGIGGGPFNIAVLSLLFSMPTKEAARNSLYIVLFSQLAGTLKTAVYDGIPEVDGFFLAGMILLAILGSEIGRRINKKISDRQATYCLEGAMVIIMAISIFNILKFFG